MMDNGDDEIGRESRTDDRTPSRRSPQEFLRAVGERLATRAARDDWDDCAKALGLLDGAISSPLNSVSTDDGEPLLNFAHRARRDRPDLAEQAIAIFMRAWPGSTSGRQADLWFRSTAEARGVDDRDGASDSEPGRGDFVPIDPSGPVRDSELAAYVASLENQDATAAEVPEELNRPSESVDEALPRHDWPEVQSEPDPLEWIRERIFDERTGYGIVMGFLIWAWAPGVHPSGHPQLDFIIIATFFVFAMHLVDRRTR